MARYEVHIPGGEGGGGFNTTLKVNAENWMSALKAGLAKLGEQGTTVQNVLVDIQDDNSIHVTESQSGRVFRIRELTEEEAARAQVKRPSQIRPPAPARKEAKTDPGQPAGGRDGSSDRTLVGPPPKGAGGEEPRTIKAEAITEPAKPVSAKPAPAKRPGNKSSPRIEVLPSDVEELEHPTRPVTADIGRKKVKSGVGQKGTSAGPDIEDVLADLFERVQAIFSKKTPEEAANFVIDLALEKVPADAGSVFHADAGSGDLTFLAARGPRARELLNAGIVIPAGTGIAGFCAFEGVSVGVSDVQKDPRFYAEVGEKVDYETKSLLCAPMMTHGRSFGCLQILNRKGGSSFAEHEVGILSYLAHQTALFLNRLE